jgi:hypothetical protein
VCICKWYVERYQQNPWEKIDLDDIYHKIIFPLFEEDEDKETLTMDDARIRDKLFYLLIDKED